MRIVIAPDKFKGTLSSEQAAHAMAEGARRYLPDAEIFIRPLADGGEGTLETLLRAVGGRVSEVEVAGPAREPVIAPIGFLDDGRACIEAASACGLALLRRPDALRAHTLGVGELIDRALQRNARRILVGVGGTASTDGGAGAARAFGWRFLDAKGNELPPGGGALVHLARIDGDAARTLPSETVEAICDVTNELLGPEGAAQGFGPQKGANHLDVTRLSEGLENLAARIESDVGVDVASVPGAGAGGGLGAGLVSFFGATLSSGFEAVARAIDLGALVADADFVITGEGRLDEQSLRGKVPGGVAAIARDAGTKCLVIAGSIQLSRATLRASGFTHSLAVTDVLRPTEAPPDDDVAVARATETLLRRIHERGTPPRRGWLGARFGS